MKSWSTKMYKGFEIDKSMRLLNGTKRALDVLAKKDVVKVVRDDSLIGYEVMKQLAQIAGDIGLDVFPKLSLDQISGGNFPYEIVILSEPETVEIK